MFNIGKMSIKEYEVDVKEMRWDCPDEFNFQSSDEITEPTKLEDIIKGQESAKEQLKNAIRLKQNAILLGPPGCGKSLLANSLAKQYASQKTEEIELTDQLLAYNFDNEFEPLALSLPAPLGKELRNDLNELVKRLPHEIPFAENEDDAVIGMKRVTRYDGKTMSEPILKSEVLKELEENEADLQRTLEELKDLPSGTRIPISYSSNPVEEFFQDIMGGRSKPMMSRDETIRHMQELLARCRREKRRVSNFGRSEGRKEENFFAKLKQKYAPYEKVSKLLDEIIKDARENKERILVPHEMDMSNIGKGDITESYKVNLIVDNSETKGMPVQYIENPSVQNMIGDVQHDPLGLGGRKPHMRAKAGKLPQANNGIAIIDELVTVFRDEGLRDYLLTCLEEKKVRIGGGRGLIGGGSSAGIETEPVEADCIIVGCANIDIRHYTTEKMARRFKHKIVFDANMPNTAENRKAYAEFISHEIRKFNKEPKNKTKLPHFSAEAVAELCEYGARFATRLENKNGREYLTNVLDPIGDIVRQACLNAFDDIANTKNKGLVGKKHVLNAIDLVRTSALKEQQDYFDKITEGTLLLKTKGKEVGYVNGLVVQKDPFGIDFFGVPARLEATISAGEKGLISIAKESKLSGEVFTKSHEVIVGYFKQRYEREKVAKYEGRLDFNQLYNPLEGDSASIATVLAFTSALSEIPIRQDIAITGSMNQHGYVQAVGGVNEKIEGFWKLCKEKGLEGQAVIIPKANVASLMLDEQLLEDVKANRFHVYAIENIDEAIEIAMDNNAANVHKKISERLTAYTS